MGVGVGIGVRVLDVIDEIRDGVGDNEGVGERVLGYGVVLKLAMDDEEIRTVLELLTLEDRLDGADVELWATS